CDLGGESMSGDDTPMDKLTDCFQAQPTRRHFLRTLGGSLLGASILASALPALSGVARAAQGAKKRVETPGKTWLEVSLNGPWSRDRQPGIPIAVRDIVEQGIACARAGASILHVHAYDEKTGRQKDDADLYAAIIE